MSRNTEMNTISDKGFPRVSGDEPTQILAILYQAQFSPRERG